MPTSAFAIRASIMMYLNPPDAVGHLDAQAFPGVEGREGLDGPSAEPSTTTTIS